MTITVYRFVEDMSERIHNYIICMYDDHFEIAGPFASTAALIAYGTQWQADNDDRPTWQSIYLDDPYAKVRVILTKPEEQ